MYLANVVNTKIHECRADSRGRSLLQVLLDKGVDEGKILFLSLIAAPEGIHKICGIYPRVKVVTSEIDEGIAPDFQVIPGVGEFGDRYFCD